MHIEKVDLNLIAPLVALLEEKHVSRAARRANLSQPAMSRALQRLRATFDDELLVRTPEGYILTPRAERVRSQLTSIVPRLNALFAGDAFDPSQNAQVFQLAGTDYAVGVIGSRLSRRIFAESPRATVRFHPWHDGVDGQIERGELDLVFLGGEPPEHLRSQQLFSDSFVCLLDSEHELADTDALTLEDYLRCRHLVIATTQGHQPAVDRILRDLGRPRRTALTIPFHALAPATLAGTKLVATLPARLVDESLDTTSICVLKAPGEIPDMTYAMAWHPRLDDDPGHRWLRAHVRAACAEPRSP